MNKQVKLLKAKKKKTCRLFATMIKYCTVYESCIYGLCYCVILPWNSKSKTSRDLYRMCPSSPIAAALWTLDAQLDL